MYTRLFTIIFLSLLSQVCQGYDDVEFTVVAKSGLNLRSAPDIKSDIIESIPFGKTVFSNRLNNDEKEYYEHGEISRNLPRFRYEGVYGFWQRVKYKDIEGFVFSAYLLYRCNINTADNGADYILFSTGDKCGAIQYRNNWNYYILIETKDSIHLKKTNVDILLKQNYSKDKKAKQDDSWFKYPYSIVTSYGDYNSLVVGSKNSLKEYSVRKLKEFHFNNERGRYDYGILLNPSVDYSFLHNSTVSNITFRGYRYGPSNYVEYRLEIRSPDTQNEKVKLDLKKKEFWDKHINNDAPRIRIMTDLNQDGSIDIITRTIYSSEGCAVHWIEEMFITNKSKNTLYTKVAEYNSYSCN